MLALMAAVVFLVTDDAGFLTAAQKLEVERRGWPVVQMGVAEARKLRHLPVAATAPAVVYGAAEPRRVFPVKTGADVVLLAVTLEMGKQTYDYACTRCHGDDGNAEGYFNVRKLGGIGSRLTTAQITERLRLVPMGNSESSSVATLSAANNSMPSLPTSQPSDYRRNRPRINTDSYV